MRAGEHLIARDYVIYRESRRQARVEKEALSPEFEAAAGAITVVGADGTANRLILSAFAPSLRRPVWTSPTSARQRSSMRH